MGQRKCVLVIPAHNEAATISPLVESLVCHFKVVVVDDCSTDNTSSIARELGAFVIRHSKNQGYEAALNTGFNAAVIHHGADVVITMDADGEHDVGCALLFKEQFANRAISLVLGVRHKPNRFAEKFIGRYLYWKYGIKDIFCGMKGYDVEIWKKKGFFDSGRSVGTELALAAIRGGTPFIQLPVSGMPRVDTSRFGSGLRVSFKLAVGIWVGLTSSKVVFQGSEE